MHTTPEIAVLQEKLHTKRKQLAEIRKEMNIIETELMPMLVKMSALNKLKQAGLSEAEVKALLK